MTAPRVEPSLADLWRRSARRATDTQLAICAGFLPMTIVASIAVAAARPHWTLGWWPIIAPPLLVAAFGIWGIGDRELAVRGGGGATNRLGWRLVQILSAATAVLSGAVTILWFLARVVGTWIS
jgi:hypothetical protein